MKKTTKGELAFLLDQWRYLSIFSTKKVFFSGLEFNLGWRKKSIPSTIHPPTKQLDFCSSLQGFTCSLPEPSYEEWSSFLLVVPVMCVCERERDREGRERDLQPRRVIPVLVAVCTVSLCLSHTHRHIYMHTEGGERFDQIILTLSLYLMAAAPAMLSLAAYSWSEAHSRCPFGACLPLPPAAVGLSAVAAFCVHPCD